MTSGSIRLIHTTESTTTTTENIPLFYSSTELSVTTSVENDIIGTTVTSAKSISFDNIPLIVSSTVPASGNVSNIISLDPNSTVPNSSTFALITVSKNAVTPASSTFDIPTAIQYTPKAATNSLPENVSFVQNTKASAFTFLYGVSTEIQNSTSSSKTAPEYITVTKITGTYNSTTRITTTTGTPLLKNTSSSFVGGIRAVVVMFSLCLIFL
jgi:hypothetical protein